jgi:hypothetical protein
MFVYTNIGGGIQEFFEFSALVVRYYINIFISRAFDTWFALELAKLKLSKLLSFDFSEKETKLPLDL